MMIWGKRKSIQRISLLVMGVFLCSLFAVGSADSTVLAQENVDITQAQIELFNDGPQYMPLRPDLVDKHRKQYSIVPDKSREPGSSVLKNNQTNKGENIPSIPDGSIKPDLPGLNRAPALDATGKMLSPQIGTKRNIVIMVDFQNKNFDAGHDNAYFNNLIFGNGNSMRSYYAQQSYGKLTVAGTVLGPYRSIHPIEYYAGDENGDIDTGLSGTEVPIYELAREAVQLAKAANPGFNWSEYDTDYDGIIDAVTIIHAGAGQEEGGAANSTIWSHKWGIYGGVDVGGGKIVYIYNMNPETGQIGVLAHEFGHVLGLPDLYDTSYDSKGAGEWELMASGGWNGNSGDCPAGLSAWSRHYLGWLDYTVPTQDTSEVQIPNINDNAFALKLWTEGADSLVHFLVENRQKIGYDSALPGEGLLVWWVNNPERYIGNNTVNYNCTMMPLEADGRWDLWQGNNWGDAGDPFPGSTNNTAFTFTSNPDSTGIDGAYTGISLWDIYKDTADARLYLADVTVKNGLLLELRTQSPSWMALDEPTVELNYVLLNDNTEVTIQVLDSNNSMIRTLVNAQTQNKGAQAVTWNGKNDSNQNVVPGTYKFRIITSIPNPYDTNNIVSEEWYKEIIVRNSVTNISNFVTRYYQLCLSREPEPEGLEFWVNKLTTGQMTGANVAENFVFSTEFIASNVTDDAFLDIMYSTFFDRVADEGGKTYWLSTLNDGMSRKFVLANFVNSNEFNVVCINYEINRGSIQLTGPADLYPKITAFVNRFYVKCMDRRPDSEGLNYWVNQLATGQQTGADISQGFIFSSEFIAKNLSDNDFMGIMYRVFFNREPDSGGLEFWLEKLSTGMSRRDVLANFVKSREFTQICSEYGIQVGVIN